MEEPRIIRGPRREFERGLHHGPDSRALFWVLLALSTLALTGMVSLWQMSRRDTARDLLEPAIASTTDIDRLLAENSDALKRLAADGKEARISIPGYPLPVVLAPQEVATFDASSLRNAVLSRSADSVYDHGLKAFDQTGNQSIARFSLQGGIRLLESQLDAGTHRLVGWASIALAVVALLSAVRLLVARDGPNKFRSVGSALLAGALPGLLVSAGLMIWLSRTGGGDPFAGDLRDILGAALSVVRRNYLVVAIFAALVTAMGPVLGLLERRLEAGDGSYAPGDAEEEELHELVPGPARPE